MIKLYYTIPLTSASCERTFSAMRRLKTWLRANTGANHLNDNKFANIQKSDMDRVDIKSVATEFIEKNDTRINYFGKFWNTQTDALWLIFRTVEIERPCLTYFYCI